MKKYYIHIFLIISIGVLGSCNTVSPTLKRSMYLMFDAPMDEVCINATTNYEEMSRNSSVSNEFKQWSSSTWQYIRAAKYRGGCGVEFSTFSDTELCNEAVATGVGGTHTIEWADAKGAHRWDWNEIAAKEARRRNLLCGVGTKYCAGWCSTNLKDSQSFNDELLCAAATKFRNAQRVWEERSPNLIFEAKRRQISCSVNSDKATAPEANQSNLSAQKPVNAGSWKERVRTYFGR